MREVIEALTDLQDGTSGPISMVQAMSRRLLRWSCAHLCAPGSGQQGWVSDGPRRPDLSRTDGDRMSEAAAAGRTPTVSSPVSECTGGI